MLVAPSPGAPPRLFFCGGQLNRWRLARASRTGWERSPCSGEWSPGGGCWSSWGADGRAERAGEEALGTAGAVDAAQLLGLQFPGFQVDEESEDVGVDGACLALLVENVQRALDGHGGLVGPIARGQRVEDVGHRHHARLQGDLGASPALGIAGAVELLVVGAGDG